MKHSIQHDPLLVRQLDLNHGSLSVHSTNCYELILIRAGSGYHMVNGNCFPYQAGDIFFLTPSDSHWFRVDQETQLYDLSFTSLYLASLRTNSTFSWGYIENCHPLTLHPLLGNASCDQTVQRNIMALVDMILNEQEGGSVLLAKPIIELLMKTIISLVDRQLALRLSHLLTPQPVASRLIEQVIVYICQHITEPNLLRLDKIADVFNYSTSHLAALFKQHAGESIQQYIIRYKLRLVEARLSLSTMNISQIANEFGFSDVCHLNKLFKRYYKHTPTTYRRCLALS